MTINRLTPAMELSHFIWSELELLEFKYPVYSTCNIGAYEVMRYCFDVANDLHPAVCFSAEDWLDVLYITCNDIASYIHSFMQRNEYLPSSNDIMRHFLWCK